MLKESLIRRLDSSEEYFRRSTSCLAEEHSTFRPNEAMRTVAQQVAHVAQTVDWFFDGAFGDGFDLDFEAHERTIEGCTSLIEAREQLRQAYARGREILAEQDDEALRESLPEGPVMGDAPRLAIVGGIEDHTAHHRGALTVYSRLLDLTPAMPYM